MAGSYGMVTDAGEHFDIEIPAFSLRFLLRRTHHQLELAFTSPGANW